MFIGIAGDARVGKDVVAAYLVQKHAFVKKSFAQPVKEVAKIIFGWNEDHVNGKLRELVDPFWEITPRVGLQSFATEACRNALRKDIWIKSFERREGLPREDQNWVISDLRFENEAVWIKDNGGKLIKVVNPNARKIASSTHQSEVDLANFKAWDIIIHNDSTFENLYKQVDNMVNSLRLEKLLKG